jgi:casein kinase 1
MLAHEAHLYNILKGEVGVPKVHWHGTESEFNVIVMDRLGPSLQNLFDACDRKFSLKTVLMLADQMITRVEQMHAKDYLHRDIKPDNFLIGGHQVGKAGLVHIIDFGLAKRYRERKTQKHVAFGEGKGFLGTARFASLNAHRGVVQGRRDDLEAVGYVLAYFLRGSLPWQKIRAESKPELYKKIAAMKESTPTEKLCEHLPTEFATFLDYCRGLSFTEKPDYDYCRRLFRDLFDSEGYENDGLFDWIAPNSSLMQENSELVQPSQEELAAAAAAAAC